jgi:hypothetical protein
MRSFLSQRLRQRLIIQVMMNCLSVCMASDCDRLVDHPQLLRQAARPPLQSSQTRIKGFVESMSPTVRGWVCVEGYPNQRLKRRLMVQVIMRQSNQIVGWAEPSVYRADVVKVYTGLCSSSDRHGFEITHLLNKFGRPLGPTTVKEVRFELFLMTSGPLSELHSVPLQSQTTSNQTSTCLCCVFGPVDFERNGGLFIESTAARGQMDEAAERRNRAPSSGCSKWLWVAGLHEGQNAQPCYGGYYAQYAAALASAQRNAVDVLVPLLLLGRFGLMNASQLSPFGRWAASKGVAVFPVARLDFQEDLVRTIPHVGIDHLMGPFLRLHIVSPTMRPHLDLLLSQRPDVCGDNILYTDSDVLFLHPLRAINLLHLVASSSSAPVVYGADRNQAATGPQNTGVMLINLPRFRSLFPKLLAYGQGRNFSFEAYDQGWLNAFFEAEMPAGTRGMMNARWNWKVYWGRPCLDKLEMLCHYRSWANPHIIHFHGPKPGRGDFLKCLASMDQKCLAGLEKIAPAHDYIELVRRGFLADGGSLAKEALLAYERFTSSWSCEL